MLSLAAAMEPYADMALAFRHVIDERPPAGFDVREIDGGAARAAALDDSAMRGLGYREFAQYLRRLHAFTVRATREFDVVLEKSWLLSGWLSQVAERGGKLGVAIENVVPSPRRHADAGLMKQLRVLVGRHWAGRCLKRSRLVIAETPQLEADIVRVWGVPADRVKVVGLGVDRARFRPIEQAGARAALGIAADATVLLYVGLLDETHNLGPAIEAVAATGRPRVELHIVGDGPSREAYATRAAGSARIVFRGRVPHDAVPQHIAVADLCLAPYDSRAFASGALGYSTMKIPEYLGVGRPVVASPGVSARELIEDGVTGFLLPNDAASGASSWRPCPIASAGRHGAARHRFDLPSWDDGTRLSRRSSGCSPSRPT